MAEDLYGARFESRRVVVDGGRVHARMSLAPVPIGPPLVLGHGLVVASDYMMPTAARFAERFRVFVPELPGFGESDRPRRPLDIDGQGETLVRWMDAMDIDRASFLAHSNGCQNVAALAERWPSRVARIVFVSPVVDPSARGLLRQAGRWIAGALREPASLVPVVLTDLRRAGLRHAWRALWAMLRDHIEERLPRIEAPALVVRGELDPVVPQRWAEEVADLLPRGELKVIAGAPHALPWDAPDALYEVAAPFLEGREPVERRPRRSRAAGISL